MPHLIIEYSVNLREVLKPDVFVERIHIAAEATGSFPGGSLRTRTSERTCFRMGDGHPDNGFIHIVLRIRPGREPEAKRRLGEQIFAAVCEYLDPIFESRPLGLTFEIQEIDTANRFLKSNMEEYLRARRPAP